LYFSNKIKLKKPFLYKYFDKKRVRKERLVNLSSKEIQNYELKLEIEKFKKETINSINLEDPNIYNIIDAKTEEFITKYGLDITIEEEQEINDDNIDLTI
jgi:hypothetical protein